MNNSRLADEVFYLEQDGYKKSQYKFQNIGTASQCLMFAVRTNSGKVYTLRIELPGDYPNSVPAVYVANPKPLRNRSGAAMLEPDASMHTLTGKDGCTRICHYGHNSWSPRQTLAKVVMKCRFWLEAYENHIATGRPLDDPLRHDPNTSRRMY